ncbi:MAG: PilZ domain-containing protein [Cognaticolwellia sp.]
MNKDFSKYQKIIDDFSGQVLNSDFEARFNAAGKNIPQTERFLLKMELKRLAVPCTRLIDLRGHVDGECKAFDHEGRTHYLDNVAQKVFTDAYADNNGYTIAVYEATMNTENNFRVIYQKEKSKVSAKPQAEVSKVFEKSQYPAKYYRFGPYFNRREERMNFAVTIRVSLEDGSHFECTSSDLSVNGCKLRINGFKPIRVDQEITLRFTGLEDEFQFGGESDFIYQVKNLTRLDNMLLVGVERIIQEKNRIDGFKQFLLGFIQGNKRRYKINLDNTINALQSRTFEQYALPKSNELPVFIEKNDGVLTPKYALTCQNNQSTYQYWQDEKHYSTLDCLITSERITQLEKLAPTGKPLLVFSFVHKNQGKTYFYTADEIQLSEDEVFMPQFLGFAAAKESFAVTQLSLLEVAQSRAESLLTLSDTLTKQKAYINKPITDEVKLLLEQIPYIVVASDVTQKVSKLAYQSFPYEGIDSVKLKKFGHKRLSKPFSVDTVGINYRNHRQELRFKYQTPAKIEIDHVKWQGISHDFSASGLMIELDKATVLVKGDKVNVSFPALQKITSAFDLTNLPYEVMRINSAKTIVNLRVFVEKHQHIGRKFFKALIDKNRDKLTSDEYAMASPGLAKALRNVYSACSAIPTVVVQTSGSRYKTEVIVGGDCHGKLMSAMRKLSDRNNYYNLYPIIGHADFLVNFSAKLKAMQQTDMASDEILYIAINHDITEVDKAVNIRLASELSSEKLKEMFIHRAQKNGSFFCVMVKLSRSAEPDMDHLNPELSYISSYALHRGKQIEQNIWSVAGLAQIFDITHETLFRYQLRRYAK